MIGCLRAVVGILLYLASVCCVAATTTYTYDSVGRITTVAYAGGLTISYVYDAAGNRSSHKIHGVPGIVATAGSPQLAVTGTAFGQPLVIRVTNAATAGVAGVTVAIAAPTSGAGAACTAPAPTDATGFTQITCTANTVVGTYLVFATASGIPGTAVFALTNYQGASGTTIQVAALPNPAIFGTTVTLTATVAGNAPGGTVNFMIAGVSIAGCAAQPVVNGQASCVITVATLGNNNVSANYSGDGQNGGGTSSIVPLSVVAETGLPDTGRDACSDGDTVDIVPASSPASVSRDGGTYPRQDCRYGRDAAAAAGVLPKMGGGLKGRDYTKIANDGTTLDADAKLGSGAADWACTKDNITGLTWEVKTNVATDLRYKFHFYTWYNPDGSANGGNPGVVGANTCNATLPSGCNTQAFVAAVNALQLCGFSDWRLPTHRELLTLKYLAAPDARIDVGYFPNPASGPTWSATTYSKSPDTAWQVDFLGGDPFEYRNLPKTQDELVRVVRGAPF